ncbi:disease resistance protein RUN1-like isoform X1 [Prosopis cineraria]|uniref:disease resistance protein RUN1-like isoform X1 n=1 Tax=Prosopis cineraria TaxID=364024 RepID=UPI002410B4D2|nr:disease resistance protein RUN1-like isoform X1 [Prosopis cineraria]XP_054795800.1 disease resistance protein RUN1-like isoform X1 [Prosopis cineraria]XP_054795801.1 disease resistance protein RUN1-like isoform X1 [Prosopis cineraria]XP_054795802.1 disease resistance protein RUN1-like isoform X1 [Prosopis cineraria]XP_054795803.1 disease resistance protein RUN1-like isoform X1 [Prosopis cineraria]
MIAAIGSVLLAAAIASVLLAVAIFRAIRTSPRCKDDVDSTSTASSSHVDTTLPATKYDVFLSFRGEDTRDIFTSHLREALRKANIRTFMDDKLPKGDNISPILLRTIEESEISVIIFSENYASSTWCMDELIHIMECNHRNGRIVIPIFYNVDPANIRKQNGSFGDGFAELEQRFKRNKEKVTKWRNALVQSTSLSGWDSKSVRPESELVKKIVEDVLRKLNRKSFVHVKGLVGIDHQIRKIVGLLREFRLVGIWGMGGIGKTTLAKAVFDNLKAQFEAFCFVENVREKLVGKGLDELQGQCLKELLKDEDINIYNMKSDFVKSRLQQKKILLILDDVDKFIAVEDLIRVCEWFGEGSRIMITSRDEHVLRNARATTYSVSKLDSKDALDLFSLKAFKQKDEPSKCHMRLANCAVDYCAGNPLALTVLGCYFHGRGKQEWESALDKLNQTPHNDIVNVLKLSFDGLDDEEQKEVFLDIAFLIKKQHDCSLNLIRQIHGSSTDIDTSVLRERSLISFDENGNVQMHDLVREMGLQIARQRSFSDPKHLVRLWRPKDIDDYFFMSNKGPEAIRCLSVDMSKIKERTSRSIKFQKMYNLIYLKVYESDPWKPLVFNIGKDVDYLSEELRFLNWKGCPLSYVPLKSSSQNLVEFRMRDSHIQQLWKGDMDFPNLKYIDVSESRYLKALPDLSQAPNLKELEASGCISLDQIHSSTVMPELFNLGLEESRRKQIKMGGTMKGRSVVVVYVFNYLDLHELAFNKVRMKMLACEEGRILCGFGYKHVHMPLENREMAELKMGAQRLACLLPFVRRVEWSKGPIEFGDFNHHYTSHFSFQKMSIVDGSKSSKLELTVRRRSGESEDEWWPDSLVNVEVRRRGGESKDGGPWGREVGNDDNDKGVEQEEVLMPQTNNTDDDMPLFKLPNAITRWSLLTELMLKESEVIGKAGDSSIPQVSILRSLAHSHSHKTTPPLMDLSLPLDIPPPADFLCRRDLSFFYSLPWDEECESEEFESEEFESDHWSCFLHYWAKYFTFSLFY